MTPRLKESPVRLSDSVLWRLQEELYLKRGVEIWRERPSFVTGSTWQSEIAHGLFFSFLLDLEKHLDKSKPLYVIELGAGSGCFAHRFLTRVQRGKPQYE